MTDIVERLRTQVHSHQRGCAICEAADEIERLRTDKVSIVVKAKDDEIERLRAALQQIADDATPGDDNYCSEIARRALEPKP